MRIMFIETETTPNPATLKFLPGEVVMTTGTREFTSDEEAAVSPLAQGLFALGDVTGVLFGRDFVAVTIAPGSEWSDAKPQVLARPRCLPVALPILQCPMTMTAWTMILPMPISSTRSRI